jgi:hypothetical protein
MIPEHRFDVSARVQHAGDAELTEHVHRGKKGFTVLALSRP